MDDLTTLIQHLNCDKKVQRKKNLLKIKEAISTLDDNNLKHIWSHHQRDLIKTLEDESERCREIGGEILLLILSSSSACHIDPGANVLIPRIKISITVEPVESSEEVRLVLAQILTQLAQKRFAEQIRPFMDDLMKIVQQSLLDSFPQIKIQTCQLIQDLSNVLADDFHLNAGSALLPNLIKNLNHQQQKVRISNIKALGCVCQHGSSEDFKQAAPQLAQRLFDPIPGVRLAIGEVSGSLAVNWNYRHVNAALLLPLLITGLEDEYPDNRHRVHVLWEEAGASWLKDEVAKDKRIKDLADFPSEPPYHYPANVERPSLGCRLWIGRTFFKLKEALAHDLKDWLVETRVKTAQLLNILILHMENEIVAFAENVLNLFRTGIRDIESPVQNYVCRSAKLFGYFVPPRHWMSLVTSRIQEDPNVHDLKVLSSILSGTDPVLLEGHLEDLGLFLQEDNICLKMDDLHLRAMLDVSNSLISVCQDKSSMIQAHLFKILFSVYALAQDVSVKASGKEFLVHMASLFGHDSLQTLVKLEMGPLLKQFRTNCSDWGSTSYELTIFTHLLSEAQDGSGFYTDDILAIFKTTLKEGNPPELKIQILLCLAKQMKNCQETLNSQKQFQNYSKTVITTLVLPHLEWHAGQKAQAVRLGAISVLWSMFASKVVDHVRLEPILSLILAQMNKLVEDNSEPVRSLVLKTFYEIFDIFGRHFPEDELLKSLTIIDQRLNDVSDEVRMMTLEVLQKSFENFQEAPSQRISDYLGHLIPKLVLHMDDENAKIRSASMDTLKHLSQHSSLPLKSVVAEKGSQNKHQQEVDALLDHLSTLNMNC